MGGFEELGGSRGAEKELLQGVTGFSGTEGSGASQALGWRSQPRGAGWVQAVPSSPPCRPGAGGGTSRCPDAPGDSGCTQRPPQNRPLSNSLLKLCLVNYSAARSRCFSVLSRRAWRWGKGKKNPRKGKRKSSPGLQSS